MTVINQIIQLLLALSILVVIHELGHFMFARIFKTRVEKFYLFFNPWFSLFRFKRGETEYGVGWVPLGGYVKISGMIDESMDTNQMKSEPKPYEFRSKPSWQRLLIMVGGALFNFLFAILIFIAVLYRWGDSYLPTENVRYGIVTDSLGHEMGLRDGDRILSVDNQYVDNFHAIMQDIILNARSSIQVERDGEIIDIDISREYLPLMLRGKGHFDARVPFSPFIIRGFASGESPAKAAGVEPGDQIIMVNDEKFDYYDQFQRYLRERRGEKVDVTVLREVDTLTRTVMLTDEGMMGISFIPSDNLELKNISYGLLESVPAGISRGWKLTGDYLKQFRVIFSRGSRGHESLGGFITIGSLFPGSWNWHAFWTMTAFISIILAIMNLLPIPALDGGHVMFLVYEVVTGRKPGDRFMEYAQLAGMIILFSLLIYANLNDIIKLFSS